MSRSLTAADRSALIRLASTLPAGSEERKAILAGLSKKAARDINFNEDFNRLQDVYVMATADFVASLTGGRASGRGIVSWPDKSYISIELDPHSVPFMVNVRGSVRPFQSAVYKASSTAKHIAEEMGK